MDRLEQIRVEAKSPLKNKVESKESQKHELSGGRDGGGQIRRKNQ